MPGACQVSDRLLWLSSEVLSGIAEVSGRAESLGKGRMAERQAIEAAVKEWVSSKHVWLDALEAERAARVER